MQYRSEYVTILIVEDDPLLGRVLERVLTCGGKTALLAHDSSQAIRLLKKHSPRLVLLDTCLRDGTAPKLVNAICEHSPALPIVLLAAHRCDQAGLPACVHRVVTKSIDLPDLRRTVEAALREEAAAPLPRPADPVDNSRLSNVTESPVHATSVWR